MSPVERRANENAPQENDQEQTPSRRQLLKALIATGGAVTASTLLPGKWSKPVVEVGVLPAHAQVSPPTSTPTPTPTPTTRPTPTPTPTPTATPRPVRLAGCQAYNADQGPIIDPDDVIETFANIIPVYDGIMLGMTIMVTHPGHPLVDQIINQQTAVTDTAGYSQYLQFDLSTLDTPIPAGDNALLITWRITDPTVSDMGDECTRDITIS